MVRISYLRTLNTLVVCFVRPDFVPVNSLFYTVSKQPLEGFRCIIAAILFGAITSLFLLALV